MEQAHTQPLTLAAILDLSRLVSSSLELDVVLDRILMAARDLSAADIVSVMMPDEDGEYLRIVAAHGLTASQIAGTRFRLGEGIAGWVALHGTPIHASDLRQEPRYIPSATPPEASLFALPLRVRDRTLGVLCLSRLKCRSLFSPTTVQMLEIFASHAAIAIDNAAAVTSLRFAAARERLASVVQREAGHAGQTAAATREILADLGATLEDARCAFYVPDESGALSLLAAVPDDPVAASPWQPADPESTLVETCSATEPELQVRVALGADTYGWLVVQACHSHYWRRAERQHAAFTADQVALLLRNERLVRQEQRSRALSNTLSQLAAASHAMVGQDTLLDFILEQLSQFLAYDSTGVFLLHDNEYARMVAGRGFRFTGTDVVLYMGQGSLTWDVRQQRRAIYIPDVQLVPGWQPVPDADVIRSWIGAPLLVNDQFIGVLTIDKWQPDAFSYEDVRVAQLFADHVAVAINNQRLIIDAQLRATQLQVVHQASDGLRAISDPEHLVDEVARLLYASCGHHQVYICLVDGDELVVTAAHGTIDGVANLRSMRRYSMALGITGWAARHNQTLLVNNVAADARYIEHPQTADTRAELAVPISHDGKVLGVIAIQSTKSGIFGQGDVHLTEAVASLTAMAMERIRRDEELRSAQEQLAHNERLRALGELASGVAHDFNNLLASILGHTQLLLADAQNEAAIEELQLIERAALDGAATVRRLQSFAQTSKALPREAVFLAELIAESLALTRPRWREAPQSRGVQIEVLREIEDVPPFAGDGPALRELMMNLILNAVDAMPAGGTLRIAARLLPAEQSPLGEPTASIEVADTGIGMDEAIRGRIFEPFFTTKGPTGTGMGLAMVYGIVQRHHGTIVVQSEPGCGASFQIFLPARPAQEEPARHAGAGPQAAPALRVMVVDDDEAVRHVLARHVTRLGHQAVEVASGELALELLGQSHYDLLCSDLGMPGMSGWELIAAAKRRYPELATLLVTGWGDQIDLVEAVARGVDGVLAKPFELERLRQVLATVQPQGDHYARELHNGG